MIEPSQQVHVPSRRGLGAVVEAMRVSHWVKNAFVVAPIVFSGQYVHVEAWVRCLLAVGAYCLLSSAVYLVNDVVDRNADRAHPTKCNRAVASGRLSPLGAVLAAVVLVGVGLGLVLYDALQLGGNLQDGRDQWLLLAWALAFLGLNVLYSFWFKNHAIVDVIAISLGFVLRAMAGAAAISVSPSAWLIVCTFTLCLFIALTKRRGEMLALPADQARAARVATAGYDLGMIDYMLTVSTALAILTYSLYCLAPRTIERFGSAHLIWTIPVVLYGMFRYDRTTRDAARSDPVSVLLRDKVMWAVVMLYVGMVLVILKYGREDAIRKILEG